MKKLNMAIIGHGFVGKAVHHGFDNPYVNITIIDPLDGADISILKAIPNDISFICVPTPMSENGEIDSSIVNEVINYIKDEDIPGLVVLKSTVVPNLIAEFVEILVDRLSVKFVYNPEFLREATALNDFVNPEMHVFGGNFFAVEALEEIYNNYSNCAPAPMFKMTAEEASFVKYGINSFLATKVLWFNQYKDLIEKYGSDYETIVDAMAGGDKRIGLGHTKSPGPDGRKGFGSACFSKDLPAFHKFSKDYSAFEILGDVIAQNNKIRNQYELNDREKAQHINFNYNPNK